MAKFPIFKDIKYFYDRKCYTNKEIKRYVELNYLTKEEYTEITGEKYPE